MPRAGLNRAAVTAVALDLVDQGGVAGFDRLTLAAVASRAGVAVPSLYKHVQSLDDLRRVVATEAVGELTRALAAATIGRSGEDAVRSAATAVRAYARAHPGRYAATQVAPHLADPADAELVARADETIQVLAAVIRGFGLPDDAQIDAIRILRSALHGFLSLELGGGFGLPDDLDRTFDRLVTGLVAALAAQANA
ncbi:TetR family transcriptional regulator [Leifsonia sp. LS1]|uniref:TetR/AcrR family transcriptional regulator n=1 Tax=unclassified Leifsonia TaxID=2663824 RepID=UPI001CBF0D6F|nr:MULTISPECIES: TetR/AcrR family transcriptional regulator [unclassified Leifsonia]UAJ78785.1 WHG domain-containing protein [Leifsonia sp. ZF2019]GIT79839.1 TetR family transcriptional regulator [Leifsonia sp. LS1]